MLHTLCRAAPAVQVVEAVERYKWNAQMLGELFDGIPVDEAGPIAQEAVSLSKLLAPAAPAEAGGGTAAPAEDAAAALRATPFESGSGGGGTNGAAPPPAAPLAGTDGQHALAAAVRRLGGVGAVRAAAAAPAAPGPPPSSDARARQLWQQQQWLQGMSDAKRQRLADVALHVQVRARPSVLLFCQSYARSAIGPASTCS